MKRLPYATGLISVALAIVLWLVATWLEDDSRWLYIATGESTETARQQTRPDTPVQSQAVIASCEQAEATLRDKVERSQYCSTDDDCTLVDYGYPIQCLMSVSKPEIPALRRAYRIYAQSCEFRVYYDCPSGNAQRTAVCREQRCTVDLVTNDYLQDKTLNYLGIERR